jgi:hypothetical protein
VVSKREIGWGTEPNPNWTHVMHLSKPNLTKPNLICAHSQPKLNYVKFPPKFN